MNKEQKIKEMMGEGRTIAEIADAIKDLNITLSGLKSISDFVKYKHFVYVIGVIGTLLGIVFFQNVDLRAEMNVYKDDVFKQMSSFSAEQAKQGEAILWIKKTLEDNLTNK